MKKFLIALLIVLLNSSIAGAWFSTPPSSSNASTLEGHAASYFQVSHAYLTDIAGISAAAGDILYFNGTNWVRLAKDVGKYLKSGASAVSWDTPSGSLPDYESAGAVLYSNGSAWIRSTVPSLLALTLYGQSAGGGAQLSLGSSSGSTDPNNGKMNFRNSTNGFLFSITSGVTAADIGWTLPTASPGGANYLLNVDADGTMGYTDPASFLTASNIAASISNADTTHCPDGNSVYDALALKQNYSSVLAALAGIAITVDGNNVTFPGGVITTAANGSRIMGTLDNTTDLTFLTVDTYGWYFYNGVPYFNVNGTGNKSMYEGGSFGGLIFGDSSPDAAGEIGYDGELKYYDVVGSKTVATVSGALGTPSFTALNMPSSNSDPSTTAGQIKHDSTDSNAASDGSIKVFTGNHVNTLVSATAVADDSYTIITKTEYIPIAYAEDGAAAPAAASVWADTRKAKIRVFAADADDDVEIHWMVPDDYVGGIKFRVVGFVNNATAPADTETVIFNLAGCSVGNSDDGGCTLGTGVDSTFTADATYAQHDRWSSAWSNEITVTNIVAGESAMLKLFRDVDDTYGQGIGVAGIEIKYKARVLMADRY